MENGRLPVTMYADARRLANIRRDPRVALTILGEDPYFRTLDRDQVDLELDQPVTQGRDPALVMTPPASLDDPPSAVHNADRVLLAGPDSRQPSTYCSLRCPFDGDVAFCRRRGTLAGAH